MFPRHVFGLLYLLISLLFSGCASAPSGVTFSLDPSFIPPIFSKNNECGKLVSDESREWLAAAALFIKEEHRGFDSTKGLAAYINIKTNGKVKLWVSAPVQVGPKEYIMELGEYGTMRIKILPNRLELYPSDSRVGAMLLHQFGLGSDRLQFDSPSSCDHSGTISFMALFRAFKN